MGLALCCHHGAALWHGHLLPQRDPPPTIWEVFQTRQAKGLEESRQVAAITILLRLSSSKVVLHGANPAVSIPMKQTMKYGWLCWVLINTSRTLFVICFLMTKKSRCFMFSRLFWHLGVSSLLWEGHYLYCSISAPLWLAPRQKNPVSIRFGLHHKPCQHDFLFVCLFSVMLSPAIHSSEELAFQTHLWSSSFPPLRSHITISFKMLLTELQTNLPPHPFALLSNQDNLQWVSV